MPDVVADPVLHGVGVVIDDCIHEHDAAGDLIVNLLEQLKDAGIPCVRYDSLPPEEERSHLNNVAFVLLDWELWQKPNDGDVVDGVRVGEEAERLGIQDNIDFLQHLKAACFAPVFIFSNLDPERITRELTKADLLKEEGGPAFILVKSKSDLTRDDDHTENRLVAAINAWTAATPSIYLLSRWREAMGRSQHTLFWDLYAGDMAWPAVLWKAYSQDNDNPEHGLIDVLHRNVRARMHPLSLEQEHIAPEALGVPDPQSVREVLEAAMIVPNRSLPAGQYGAGDLFKGTRRRYLLNIRCDCDCIPRGNGETPAEPILYLLTAKAESQRTLEDYFDTKRGMIQRYLAFNLLFPVDGKPLLVDFQELRQATPSQIETEGFSRVGRVTPPHITQVRQRFALYLQREGLPRIPNEAVTTDEGVAAVSASSLGHGQSGRAKDTLRSHRGNRTLVRKGIRRTVAARPSSSVTRMQRPRSRR